MDVRSLGWRTDLALLELTGSLVEQHPEHVVVRTPDNPGYHWGNFLLVGRPPRADEVPALLETFARELPGIQRRSVGLDSPEASAADLGALADHGFDVTVASVLTAEVVLPPPRPHATAVVRPLTGDADWEARRALDLACEPDPTPLFAAYARRRAAAERRVVERGHGWWYGAFVDGRLLSSLGIVRTSEGLARYQEVQTRTDARGRGLAGTLVHAAGAHALADPRINRLVIVADTEDVAIRIYRSVGFTDRETQVRAGTSRG
jgi:RimJ/RimL family protein N-acetyltransferase